MTFKKYGIGVKFVHGDDPKDFEAAIDEKTKAIFVESIGNPKYNVVPIPELAQVGRLYVKRPTGNDATVVLLGCPRPRHPFDCGQYLWNGRIPHPANLPWCGYRLSVNSSQEHLHLPDLSVVHSATKWIGGHGTTIAGVVIDSGM